MERAEDRTGMSRELEWIVPGLVLTCALAAFTLWQMPRYAGVLPALMLLPLWMLAAAVFAGLAALGSIVRMMRNGIEHPGLHCIAYLRGNWRRILFVSLCMVLAGFNMITFMWVKPLLNYLVPFWADPYLASFDRQLFGTDPWRLLTWLNVTPLAIFYHRGWFALMIVVLMKVLASRPSPQKSAILLTYFLLWSVFGPVGHMLLPAGGPVFFAHLGHGGAFDALVMEPETRKVAQYLWRFYDEQSFGPGAGISAMPSLHIATTAWIVIAVRRFAPRWTLPMTGAGVLIFLLSISLGWHYAVDGVVGALGAFVICRVVLRVLNAPRSVRPMAVKVAR